MRLKIVLNSADDAARENPHAVAIKALIAVRDALAQEPHNLRMPLRDSNGNTIGNVIFQAVNPYHRSK